MRSLDQMRSDAEKRLASPFIDSEHEIQPCRDVLDLLDVLAAKATPEPWVWATYDKRLVSDATAQTVGCTQADIEFIAAFRNAWPGLRKLIEAADGLAEACDNLLRCQDDPFWLGMREALTRYAKGKVTP